MADQPTRRGRKRQVVQLPVSNFRECAACHEDRPIVSRGLCNRCHLRQKRAEQKMFMPASAVSPARGYSNLVILHKLMDDSKVSGTAKRGMLRLYLPFSGLSPAAQEVHLKELDAAEDAAEDVARGDEQWPVHEGSGRAPADSVSREPEAES